jgi:hypothetical protein
MHSTNQTETTIINWSRKEYLHIPRASKEERIKLEETPVKK